MELGEKYAYTVYETKSFSKAATRHYITQAALSSSIKNLENKLGFTIFDRSKSPVRLTPEGKIYVQYLEEIMATENSLKQKIDSLRSKNPITEKLSIGGTSLLAYNILPSVCAEFGRKFPHIEVMIDVGEFKLYTNMFEDLDSNVLQFLVSYTCDNTKYSYIPLIEARYVIAVRSDFVTSNKLKSYALTRSEVLSGRDYPEKTISDFKLFDGIKFHQNPPSGIIWRDMADFLSQCSFSHHYVSNTRKNDIAYNMMLNGLGAVVTTDYVISKFPESEDVLYFLVNTQKRTRQAMLIYKKDRELSPAEEEFIRIAQRLVKNK